MKKPRIRLLYNGSTKYNWYIVLLPSISIKNYESSWIGIEINIYWLFWNLMID